MRERDWRRLDLRDTGSEDHGIVDTTDLADMGIPGSTTARWKAVDDLARLAPRTYLVVSLLDERSPYAALLRSAPTAALSHRCGAEILGLDGCEGERMEVLVPHTTRLRRTGPLVHRTTDLQPHDVVLVDGLRCTNATRTLCDLGAVVDASVLERALESALRQGLTTAPRLWWRSGQLRRRGRSGPAALQRLLAARPTGAAPTGSDLETRFLQLLRAGGLPEPERQHQVRRPDGSTARLDLAYPAQRVFVELDGDAFHSTSAQRRRDRVRQTDLVSLGWRPLRFGWSEVVDRPDAALALVRAVLAQAA